jgi:hypothetical protein
VRGYGREHTGRRPYHQATGSRWDYPTASDIVGTTQQPGGSRASSPFLRVRRPEVLRLEQAPTPEPGPGEILVQTEVIGVTLPSVRKVRGEGDRAPLPGVLGGEIAGHIIAVGPQVADSQSGIGSHH